MVIRHSSRIVIGSLEPIEINGRTETGELDSS